MLESWQTTASLFLTTVELLDNRFIMGYDIPSLFPLLSIPTTTDPSIVSESLLLVAAGLVKVIRLYGPANASQPLIPQDLVSCRGGNIGGRGHAVEVAVAIVAFVVAVLPT